MIETDKYLISLNGCRITCNYRQEPQVRITTVGPKGVSVQHKPFTEVFHAVVMPFFTATYAPRFDEFIVDLDVGAQRWLGPQSAAAVRAALRKCGVAAKVARKIVAEAVKGN